MEITAQAKHIRVSPRKAGLVAGLVRGRQVNEALSQLKFVNKKAGRFIGKLLKSAIANAKHNYDLTADNLTIKQIWVGKGATFHRWMPKAHGRATPLNKTTSHITIVLGEIKDSGPKSARRVEAEAPLKLSELANKGEGKISDQAKDLANEAEAKAETFEQAAKRDGGSKSGFVKKVFQRKAG
ncbi:50S ribosomal protein L22 [Candidatus Falkowbacteria bacterium]|nr:50S ribosomal protein L22 [Candidatus Falkowbacteria bacterium]